MITVHSAKAVDFSTLGLGALTPVDAEVEEQAGAMFQLTMTHPMDANGKWWNLQKYNILKAPAPMRETPYLHIEGITEPGTTVTREIYKVRTNTGARLRLRSKPSLSAPIIKSYYPGTEVVRVSVDGDWARVIICSGGATGYMWNGYLTYVRTESETVPGEDVPAVVVQPRQTRDQLFRIDSIEKDDARQQISVTALHISYDLAKNTVKGECVLEKTPAKQAVAEIMNRASNEHSFTVYCNIDAEVSGDFSGWQIAAALWGDGGIVQQTGARLIRDNYDIFILADEERDRGVEIRHGKNLTGAIMTEDVSNAVSRIIPLGRDKDGNRLMIDGEGYIDSPRSASIPIVSSREIEYDVRVGTDGIETAEQAKVKLAELAAADFENGADGAVVGLDVDFIALEDTVEYERYAALQTVHLYDTVHVISTPSRIRVGIRVNGYRCRVTGRRPRYTAVMLGEITELESTVYGYDIADGTLSGTKILPGSADGSILRNATIQYAKIAQAAIDKLAADAITAVRADINKVVAGEITTDQLYVDLATVAVASIENADIDWAEIESLTAQVASIVEAKIESADIDWANIATLNAQIAAIAEAKIQNATISTAQIDRLEATIAKVISAEIATGTFDLASIKNLLASAFVLEQGTADSIYIKNLAVTAANLLSATLGELVLKGSDGRYYKIVIGSDGTISTQATTVSDSEITAGQTAGGQMIVETTANIADLNATTIKGSQAILNTILTESLTAGKITAGQALIASATIPALYVTSVQAIGDSIDFSANRSIQLMVAEKTTVYRQEAPPVDANVGDLWVKTSKNYFYQAVGAEDGAPEFYLSEDGYLAYRYEEDETAYSMTIDENGWLVIDESAPFVWAAAEDGTLTAWARVKDADLTAAELRITDDAIVATVTSSTEFEAIQSSIRQNAAAIELRVTSEQLKKSGVTIEEDEVSIISDNFILQLLDPNDNETVLMEMSASGNGGFKQLYAEKIYSPSVVSTYDEATITVASAAELETLLQELQNKHLTGTVTIDIQSVTSGNYELYGVSGPGAVILRGGTGNTATATINSLKITRCSARVELRWTNLATSGTAITADASNVRIGRCVFNALNGIRAEYGAKVDALYCSGVCTGYVAEAVYGSDVYFTGGTIPQGLPKVSGTGNIYTAIAFAPVPSDEEPEELPTITTVSLKPTLTKTFRGSSWRDTNYLWQGRYGTASLSRGCMWFDTSAFAGKTILSATLRLTRMTGSGAGVFVTANIYGTTAAGASGTPAIGTKYASVDLDQGETRTVDVTAAIAALAGGAISGLMLYDSDTENLSTSSPYTRHYAKFYGYDHASSPLLTVTYK